MPRYKVLVDENAHFMDEDERWEHGVYDTLEEALAVCRRVVELSLQEGYRPGITAEELFTGYKMWGDDPFIVVLDGPGDPVRFSAWTYAEERCRELCGAKEPDRRG